MYNPPELKEKLICSTFYIGIFVPIMTWVPIIWLIYCNIRKIYLKDFIKYHCYQAVLFNMIIFFLPQVFALLISFLSNILDLLVIFSSSVSLLKVTSNWIIETYQVFIKVVSVYAVIWTGRGKFTEIPPISQAVNLLLR